MHRAALVHHPEFTQYDFGPQHPLRPERLTLGLDMLQEAGLWAPCDGLTPDAEDSVLESVHEHAYIQAVQDAGFGTPPGALSRFGFASADNPPFPNMHEPSALIAAGSAQAARLVMSGELDHAFNPAGGLHHALRARASGFCVYNDAAVAAAVAAREFGARVLYIDVDAHHGDGVQWIFYDDPQVMTVSFHESGRFLFPGTGYVEERGEGRGEGYALNVPFAPYTRDGSWLEAVEEILPQVAESFQPDIVLSAHGSDTHGYDPLTHLDLSTHAMARQAQVIHALAHEHAEGRWLAFGSGGYAWQEVVPRHWSILWSEMTGRALPAAVPPAWLDRWGGALPNGFLETPRADAPAVAAENARTLRAVREALR